MLKYLQKRNSRKNLKKKNKLIEEWHKKAAAAAGASGSKPADSSKPADPANPLELTRGEKPALLQVNEDSKMRRTTRSLKHRRQGLLKANVGAISKPGEDCKKDNQCEGTCKHVSGSIVWKWRGKCGPVPFSLNGGDKCSKDNECASTLCIGNTFSDGTCAHQNLATGENCQREKECKSKTCSGGKCGADMGSSPGQVSCHKNKECASDVCRGNMGGGLVGTLGHCLFPKAFVDEPCDDDRECVSKLGCTETGKSIVSADKKKRDQYKGKCRAETGALGPAKPCTVNKECKSKYCKDADGAKPGACSDDEKPGVLTSIKNGYAAAKQYVGDKADEVKRYVKGKLFSKSMPAIEKGIPNEMSEDFRTMFGVSVHSHQKSDEKFWIHGDAYREINKFGLHIRNDPGSFREAFYQKALGNEQTKLLIGLPPVVEYTITFTLDIESEAPGFCTPSGAALQVIMSKSWTGITTDAQAFNKRQMCMSLRLATKKTYFMVDMCYDLPDCKGLQDIDDEGGKENNIVSNIEIGFSVFEFLQASQFSTLAGESSISGGMVGLIEVDAPTGSEATEKVPVDTVSGDNVPAAIDTSPESAAELRETASTMSTRSMLLDKVKSALDGGALLGSQAVGSIFSKKMAWAFAQAFVQDDELTNSGDKDFMKYGVSLASLAQFFYSAVTQAKIVMGGSAAKDTNMAALTDTFPKPDSSDINPVSFKLNNELVLEGRGSITLQKRACTGKEKKTMTKECNDPDTKYYGINKCGETACEVGLPISSPGVSLTFQSWFRAELKIAVPPVTVFPTLGVEIEFDITSMLYMGVNARRAADHKKRVNKCKQCISADQAGQAGDGFCNKKWKSVEYTIADDACVPIVKDTNHRLQCEQQGPTGGDDDDPIKFQWIDTLEGCNDMDFPLQTATDPTFFGNELGMGGKARS